MNEKSAVKAESNWDRRCSATGTVENGIVLHSAKFRNTVFLKPGRQSRAFLVRYGSVNSQEAQNRLVESYFI